MNFNDYSKSKKTTEKMSPDTRRMVMNFLSSYNGKSQEEIWSAVLETAEKNRANGTLSDADIDNFAKMLEPMLNGEQKNKLKEVVKKLKET